MNRLGKIFAVLFPVVIGYYVFSGDNFNPESIRGKRILVTGASSGIGKQVAYKYAELGARLVITARRTELLDEVAKKCKVLGAKDVHAVTADMASPEDRKKLVESTGRLLGGLDFLILNHAIFPYAWWDSSPERMNVINKMMEINFMSYVDLTSRFMKFLEESNGYICVVSSIAGKYGLIGLSPYSATKHALQGFYSSLRQELRLLKKNVSVTVIVYGGIDTEGAREVGRQMSDKEVESSVVVASAADAADVLIRGVSGRLYEVYFPAMATVFQFFYKLMPNQVEDLVNDFMNFNVDKIKSQ